MTHLRLAAAELNTVVGDLAGNVERILRALADAESAGADLCIVPELAIPGYPPEDLLLKPGFVADNVTALEKVAGRPREGGVGAGVAPRGRRSRPAVGSQGSIASTSSPTTACSTSSAGSCQATRRPLSSLSPGPGW